MGNPGSYNPGNGGYCRQPDPYPGVILELASFYLRNKVGRITFMDWSEVRVKSTGSHEPKDWTGLKE